MPMGKPEPIDPSMLDENGNVRVKISTGANVPPPPRARPFGNSPFKNLWHEWESILGVADRDDLDETTRVPKDYTKILQAIYPNEKLAQQAWGSLRGRETRGKDLRWKIDGYTSGNIVVAWKLPLEDGRK